MPKTEIVRIECAESEDDAFSLGVSQDLSQVFQIVPREIVTVAIGASSCRAQSFPIEAADRLLQVSRPLAEALHIPVPCRLEAVMTPGRILRLGPVYGILAEPYSLVHGRIGRIKAGYLERLAASQYDQPSISYIFQSGDIDFNGLTVQAAVPVKNKHGDVRFSMQTLPLPDVIHNRLFRYRSEVSEEFTKLVSLSQSGTIPIFNRGFIKKRDMHECFRSFPEVAKHIPETILHPEPDHLKSMLSKYNTVYLKPAYGSLGVGIQQISKYKKGQYMCRYRRDGANKSVIYLSMKALLRKFPKKKLSPFILQQGIELLTYRGAPFDFRLHIHKDKARGWQVTAVAAKVAGKGNITTHERYGGTIMDADRALEKFSPEQRRRMLRDLNQAAVEAAAAVDALTEGEFAEFGIDACFDKHGRIWIFEVNSKPGRSIFRLPSLKSADELSIRRIFEYGRALTAFREEEHA